MTRTLRHKTLSLRGLFAVYACLVTLLLLLSLPSYLALHTTVDTFEAITEREFVELRRMFFLQDAMRESALPVLHYAAWGSPDEAQAFEQRVQEVEEVFRDVLSMGSMGVEQRGLILTAREHWQDGVAVGRSIFAIPATDGDALRSAEQLFTWHITSCVASLYEAHNVRIADTTREKEEAIERHRNVLVIAAITAIAATVAFAFAVLILLRQIIQPLKLLRDGILRIGDGDLSSRIDLQVDNELGELARGINCMAARLAQDQVELEQLAIRDSLTDLYNRREFERLLSEELHRASRYRHPLSMLLIDIDKFKEINDTLGHRAGDHALRLVSSVIRDISRKGDIVARYGGDELAALLPETPAEDAIVLAERIRRLVSHQYVEAEDGTRLGLTLSIGVASTSGEITSAEKLVDAADSALYMAKTDGRNCVRRGTPTSQADLPLTMP